MNSPETQDPTFVEADSTPGATREVGLARSAGTLAWAMLPAE